MLTTLPASLRAVPLLRAYFADTSPKESRTGRFGLIGVITSASLFVGPSLGGEIARAYGRRAGCWLSAGLCVLASFISFLWHPDEAKVDEARMQRSNTFALKGDELAHHLETHRTVNGVKMVRIDLGGEEEATSPTEAAARDSRDASGSGGEGGCCQRKPCRTARKAWRFAKWLGTYDLWPLMSLNFFFRFAFAAYKSVFAFFCMALLNYGAREVGYLLSCMGARRLLTSRPHTTLSHQCSPPPCRLPPLQASAACSFRACSFAWRLGGWERRRLSSSPWRPPPPALWSSLAPPRCMCSRRRSR